ncbi:hypothetical protein ACOUXA_15345 [Acinetobacter baumannii]|nr:hypothetical protein [Acinetobacter baumannii]MDC4444988.1 hypothetical protein [Acinetobacter baumannii]MDO7332303.1 hypothetical protein [Acinetobacter baumannii]MDO7466792.1 hypothetical protein [Acinetobacter baumannii]MDO7491667.1 hypothetical protein [Acinetobacter baumannii]
MTYNIPAKANIRGINNSLCFFLLLFCSFFSVNSLPINPVYCLSVPTLIVSFLFFKRNIDKLQLFLYLYFILSAVFFAVGVHYFSFISNEVRISSSLLYLYCILLGAQVILVGRGISKNKRIKLYNIIYNILIFFMFLELLLRIAFSGNFGSFYDYKQSFFFTDSNFSSFIILFFLMFAIFLKSKKILDIGRFRFLILFFLLLMTFSRASIFAFLVSYLFIKSNNKYRTPVFIAFILIYIYFSYRLVGKYISGESYVDVDGSFNTKFYFISIAINDYPLVPLINKFFGIGLNNFFYYSDGFFAHNIFVTFLYEFGILGFLIFLLFIFFSYRKIGKDLTYILMPLLVAGFSLFSAYMPFFFVLLACMYIEVKDSKKQLIV